MVRKLKITENEKYTMTKSLKNVKNEKCTPKDGNMARKLKINENEKYTLYMARKLKITENEKYNFIRREN
ncbi:Uncharacterised protein [Chlamydia abortus]|nr:Uncharacterised protein [Chlamydia abortus]